jgi:Ni/Co efflux regulator RcnB
MKKLLSALIGAALIAMPLAVISTPVAAQTATQAKVAKAKHVKKSGKAKAKAKKPKTRKSSSTPAQ